MSKVRLVVVACVVGGILALAGPAAAARPTSLRHFYSCVGDGPTTFDAIRTATPAVSGATVSAAAAHYLTDGSGLYIIVSYGEGNFDPPGIRSNAASVNLVCLIDFVSIGTTTVYGIFVPTP